MEQYGVIRNIIYPAKNCGGKVIVVDLSNYLTVRQVAKKLDLTEERVRELINLKQIKATKIRQWRIKSEDLEIFVKSRTNKK